MLTIDGFFDYYRLWIKVQLSCVWTNSLNQIFSSDSFIGKEYSEVFYFLKSSLKGFLCKQISVLICFIALIYMFD